MLLTIYLKCNRQNKYRSLLILLHAYDPSLQARLVCSSYSIVDEDISYFYASRNNVEQLSKVRIQYIWFTCKIIKGKI